MSTFYKECSAKADAEKLHGKARMEFRAKMQERLSAYQTLTKS